MRKPLEKLLPLSKVGTNSKIRFFNQSLLPLLFSKKERFTFFEVASAAIPAMRFLKAAVKVLRQGVKFVQT